MTDLNDDLAEPARSLLRDYVQPSMEATRRAALQERVMSAAAAGVVPELGPATASAGKSAVALKILAGGAVACAGLAYLLLGGGGDPPERERKTEIAVVATPAPAPPPVVEPAEVPAAPSEAMVTLPSEAAPEEEEKETAPTRQPPNTAPAATPDSTAGEEARLLARAQLALRSGKHREALDAVEEHARRFPTGKLVEAREAARAVARCNLEPGSRDGIRAQFESRFGSSAFLRRVANACSVEEKGT